MATNEYFLFPVSPTVAAWIEFPDPSVLPLEERDDFMTTPPDDVIDAAPRVPIVPASPEA
jgi:hypothetical protein